MLPGSELLRLERNKIEFILKVQENLPIGYRTLHTIETRLIESMI